MKDKINVAIIAGQLVVGGAERQLYLWLANLDRQRYNPYVITLHPGHGDYWEKPIEDLNIPLIRIPHHKFRLLRLMELIKILKSIKPQLIHGWHLFTSPYAGLIARLIGSKSLGSLRDSYRMFLKNPVSAFLTIFLVDSILVNSQSASQVLKQKKFRRGQDIYSVENAFDSSANDHQLKLDTFLAIKNNYGGKILIGTLGRLDKKKDMTCCCMQ